MMLREVFRRTCARCLEDLLAALPERNASVIEPDRGGR